jgi:hypothetical protein
VLGGSCGRREECVELVELDFGALVVRQSSGACHLTDDRVKRAIAVLGRAEIPQMRASFGREAF